MKPGMTESSMQRRCQAHCWVAQEKASAPCTSRTSSVTALCDPICKVAASPELLPALRSRDMIKTPSVKAVTVNQSWMVRGAGGVRDSLSAGMLPMEMLPAGTAAFLPPCHPSPAIKTELPTPRRARARARPRATEIIAPETHVPTVQGDPLDK